MHVFISLLLTTGYPFKTFGLYPIAWHTITTLKLEGGLSLRPLKEVNATCYSKLIGRIPSFQSMCGYLLKSSTFWVVREGSSLGSWMWQKILKYRDKAKCFHLCKCGMAQVHLSGLMPCQRWEDYMIWLESGVVSTWEPH